MGTKNHRAVYEWVNISDDLVYEWVRFFKGQVYEWGRFPNTGSHSRTKITPKLPPPPTPTPPGQEANNDNLGNLFAFLHNNCMLNVHIRISSMRRF